MQTKDTGEPFQRITVDQAKAMIERGTAQIVDVRQPSEYAAGHLYNSLLIPLDKLLDRSGDLREDRDLIFVCAVGQRSAVASEMAAAVGRTRVYNLEGGFNAWQQRGYPVEK